MLKGLDVSLERGEMVAIVGASGVGKSTLLHVVGGLDSADEGTVRMGDTDADRLIRCRRGGVPESPCGIRLPVSSPAARVQRARECRDADADRAPPARRSGAQRAAELLHRVGLEPRLEHRPGMLSGGEQQRVAIARALVMEPTLLLADEPTGDLDEHTADSLHDLLREMHRERGLTSIIATHNTRLAAACDRVLRLEDGRLKQHSATRDFSPRSPVKRDRRGRDEVN